MKEAKVYFKARFGLGHTSFYEILRPHLRLRALAPDHLGTGASAGLMLFAAEVVAACNELAAGASGDYYYR